MSSQLIDDVNKKMELAESLLENKDVNKAMDLFSELISTDLPKKWEKP